MKKNKMIYALSLLGAVTLGAAAYVNYSKADQAPSTCALFVESDNIALAESYSCVKTKVLSCFVPSQNPADIGYILPDMRAITPGG